MYRLSPRAADAGKPVLLVLSQNGLGARNRGVLLVQNRQRSFGRSPSARGDIHIMSRCLLFHRIFLRGAITWFTSLAGKLQPPPVLHSCSLNPSHRDLGRGSRYFIAWSPPAAGRARG